MQTKEQRAAGSWPSPLTADMIAGAARRLSDLRVCGDYVYALEMRPGEGGRTTLIRMPLGNHATGQPDVAELVSPDFSVRSRVHEYGGGGFCVHEPATGPGHTIVFSNDQDSCLYIIEDGSAPRILTAPDQGWRFADLQFDRKRERVLAVAERHGPHEEHPRNHLVAVPLATGTVEILAEGPDFYASPRLSPDSSRMLWLEWNHPDMPWDRTTLAWADLTPTGDLGPAHHLQTKSATAIFQPDWLQSGDIAYVSDESGWWNLRSWSPNAPTTRPLHTRAADFGRPLWVLGMSTWAELTDGRIFATYVQVGSWRAGLAQPGGSFQELNLPFCEIADVTSGGTEVAFVGAQVAQPTGIWSYDSRHATGSPVGHDTHRLRLLRQSSEVELLSADISTPDAISFPCKSGHLGHAFLYLPKNSRFEPLPSELPPVILRAHGGPSAAASSALRLDIQYWTTRGFAILDVNYRGSTGFGRAYREALNGQWGVADVEDCLSALETVAAAGRVDGTRSSFSGGSAGGLSVLSALAFHDVFRAGAVYYGIGDLTALAKGTHKFELRYLDRLIGPYPESHELYRERSPLFAASKIEAPVILFQGLRDQVVPPEQTRAIEAALKSRGIRVEAHYFPNEGHGFRSADVIRACLEAEQKFYLGVFGIE